jgi:toxin ParE1/3/4
MTFNILLTASAEYDLLDLHFFVELNDSSARTDALLGKIEHTILSLDQMPQRGHHPPELARLGIHDYREIHFKPYRIIYEIVDADVLIHAVIDGRRDLRDLLTARLLR